MKAFDLSDLPSYDFYSPEELPLKLYGVCRRGDRFRRIPEEVAREVSEGVFSLHDHTSGGRVRFVTNSKRFCIKATITNLPSTSNASIGGLWGFDLYTDKDYRFSLMPPPRIVSEMTFVAEGILPEGGDDMRLITVNMPSYAGVKAFVIGVEKGALVKEAPEYKHPVPIVYYGSSITQGGCASRPGAIYQNVIARRIDCDYLSLGFSGNAKAEETMMRYIAGLKMSLFVLDYDHNAPTEEHLLSTHEKFFKGIREANPTLPILILSRPKCALEKREEERLECIKTTYENALAAGDENVYFISGPALMQYAGYEGTVDNCHPNDLGFASMGRVIGDFLEEKRFFG